MAATTPLEHGITVIELVEGPRVIRTVATSIIGLVAIAEDADAATFPLNTPVRLTNLPGAIAKAGLDGTLKKSLTAIDKQANAIVVVVRVAEGLGDTPEEIELATRANVIAGVNKLLLAEQICKVRPRILAAPGLDSQSVTVALGAVAAKLNAMAYCSCGSAVTITEAIELRAGVSGREICLIYGDFLDGEEVVYATAVAAGHRALLDQTVGFQKTLSNVPVKGVTGVTAPVTWELQRHDTEAALLNGARITVLIEDCGLKFWGNRTCSPEPKFEFESAVRTAQTLRDTVAYGLKWATDKDLYPSLAIDLIETINTKLDEMRDSGKLIGGKARLADDNTTTSLAGGQLRILYDFTPVPPLEHLHLTQVITDEYFFDFAAAVAAA